jgi:hypothetical protein
MRDYKVYLPHHRDLQFLDDLRKRDERLVNALAVAASVFALAVLIWLVCVMAVDAVVKTAEMEEEKAKTWLAETYQRPLAYRLASPAAAEMDSLHALRDLQPLVRR